MAFLKFIFLLLIALPFAVFLLFILDKVVDELQNVITAKRESVSPVSAKRNHTVNHIRNNDIKDSTNSVDKMSEDSAVKRDTAGSKRKRRKERKQKKKAEKDNE